MNSEYHDNDALRKATPYSARNAVEPPTAKGERRAFKRTLQSDGRLEEDRGQFCGEEEEEKKEAKALHEVYEEVYAYVRESKTERERRGRGDTRTRA